MIHLSKGSRVAIILHEKKIAEAIVLQEAWDIGIALVRLVLGSGPGAQHRAQQMTVCLEYLAHVV